MADAADSAPGGGFAPDKPADGTGEVLIASRAGTPAPDTDRSRDVALNEAPAAQAAAEAAP